MQRAKKPNRGRRNSQPDNLLDLNRSLSNYAYHPGGGRALRTRSEIEKSPRPLWKRILLWVLVPLLLFTLVVGGWVGYKLLANEIRVFGWGGIFSLLHSNKLKGEDQGRVNILLAGNSADDPGHGGANLTDSIMLLSIDTKDNTAFMVSIPRDLYVNIPEHGHAKINEAYEDGEADNFQASGYPDGGMGLLAKVVSEEVTGMPIHYYALIDYAAVREGVDAVGGITVNIDSPDPRGLYDPSPDLSNNYKPLVKLPNGPNNLDGVHALGLARARGNSYNSYGYALSDFQRGKNQRLIMIALKDKVTTASTLSNPVKLGNLFDAVGKNLKTDMSLGEARRFYDLLKKIPNDKIISIGLNDVNGKSMLDSYTTPNGQAALIPAAGRDDFSDIQSYLQSLITPPTTDTNKN